MTTLSERMQNIRRLLETSVEVTRQFKSNIPGDYTPEADPKLAIIARICKKFNCHEEIVRELVSTMMDVTLPPPPVDAKTTGLVVFVPGQILVRMGDCDATPFIFMVTKLDDDLDALIIDATGDEEPGGETYVSDHAPVRAATEEEMSAFITAVKEWLY